MNHISHCLFPNNNQIRLLGFNRFYCLKMLYRRMRASIKPVTKCLQSFGQRATESLQCQMYIFIPSLFIVTAFLLLTAFIVASLPHFNVGPQRVRIRGQIICCSGSPFDDRQKDLAENGFSPKNLTLPTNAVDELEKHPRMALGNCPKRGGIRTENCWVVPRRAVELHDFDWRKVKSKMKLLIN